MKIKDIVEETLVLSRDILSQTGGQFYDNINEIEQFQEEKFKNLMCAYLEKSLNKPINVCYIDFESDCIYGALSVDEQDLLIDIYIAINRKKSNCWQRFVICKEMVQLYVDMDPDRSSRWQKYKTADIITQIKETNEAQRKLSIEIDKSYDFKNRSGADMLASYIAADLFFKKDYKGDLYELEKDLNKGNANLTYYDIADMFKCPEYITEHYMKEINEASYKYDEQRKRS